MGSTLKAAERRRRVLVCGGRDYTDWRRFEDELNTIRKYSLFYADVEIISGGAKGADTLARHYSMLYKIWLQEFPADWKQHGRAAGPIRNQKMLDEGKPEIEPAQVAEALNRALDEPPCDWGDWIVGVCTVREWVDAVL